MGREYDFEDIESNNQLEILNSLSVCFKDNNVDYLYQMFQSKTMLNTYTPNDILFDKVFEIVTSVYKTNRDLILDNLRNSISKNLDYFKDFSSEEIMNERKNKFLKIGRSKGFVTNPDDLSTLSIKKNNIDKIIKSKKVLIGSAVLGLILFMVLAILFY